jgi:hypothetical protein
MAIDFLKTGICLKISLPPFVGAPRILSIYHDDGGACNSFKGRWSNVIVALGGKINILIIICMNTKDALLSYGFVEASEIQGAGFCELHPALLVPGISFCE